MSGRVFKFLVVADGTPESRLAAYFAALRAEHTGGKVSLLTVIQPSDFHHWIGVSAEMGREARAQAEALLAELGEEVMEVTHAPSEYIIREGDLRVELMHLIEEDRDIRILCLGAAPGGNPGPLVSALARGARGMFGKRSIPIAVVPGSMTRQDVFDIA